MKFGRNLPRNVVPEWSSNYINYKALKKLIKSASVSQEAKDDVDLVGFFYSLDRNLEDVDYFYNKKLGDFTRRLKILEDRYGNSVAAGQALGAEDIGDLVTALLELRGQLRKLQWYGEVNRRGFIKITKKLDKKIPGAEAQKRYLAAKVDPAPFATNAQLTQATSKINEWLSVFGDRKVLSDDSDSVKSLTLSKVPSRPNLNLPASLLSAVDAALREDDTTALLEQLQSLKVSATEQGELVYPMVKKNLLQRAITCRARSSIDVLLGEVDSLEEEDDINKRNCIHRLVISIGRAQTTSDADPSAAVSLEYPEETTYITPATPPSLQPPRNVVKEAHQKQLLTRDDEAVSLLQYLLDHLRPHQRSALLAQDLSGRTPLHYGAQYGFRVVCEIIIEHLKKWDLFDVSEGIDGPNWQDSEGWAPLHLSVVGGHPLTTKALLEAEEKSLTAPHGGVRNSIRKNISKSSAVLAMAVKANFVDIVQLLVEAGVDINYQDEQGETALHVAARFNHSQCARLLLEGTADQKANTELPESTYSWTPLFIACVDGSLAVVELLIKAGADLERPDSSGWTAKEHAALRGHLEIAKRLAEVTKPPTLEEADVSITVPAPTSSPPLGSLTDRKSNINSPSPNYSSRAAESLKTFGHRYLTDESMILVSLGTMDMRKTSPPVSLDRIPITSAHSTQLDTALSVVISASGAHGEPEIIDLPVQDSIVTEPITFYSKDFTSVRLLFDLVPTYAGSTNQIVGRGVALLSSIRPSVGSNRISLQGDITVPIIAANTLEVIGTLTFNFLVITPFKHPKMSLNHDQTYWKTVTAPMVIGHRGLGKNFASRRSLQLGENTVQSFIAAANLGASYVEFDVQLTKDHVPVIYHDFLVSETGIDAPVHTLTLEQFLHLNDARSPRVEAVSADASQRPRAMSVGEALIDPSALSEKMKHTRDFKAKGFKGNTRGNHIQAPFATLEELFKKLPKSVGFNIEMKYPSLYESEAEEMDTYAVEVNSFVDTVLEKVYDLGEGRNMIFSSFNPDICLLLAFKQPSIPVLFLTDAGSSEVADIRCSSLQEAIRFASRWNLLGIVSTAEPFVLCPRLVRVVKESGLVCVSYGIQNNDPANAKLQVTHGIDAVIVDSVLAIRKGLTTAPPSNSVSPLSMAQASSSQTLQPPADISTLDKPSS
ncbi:glycerophosphocholine phosphodiesterase Gde1, putative [Talaromyces stipitatus ATCC 10500]|uniref:Glycerophosphocholine phosphodiesterase Gde1, putative n=1 Tax=Talaromyces stipitatus (strain ATCC 10500 / CBS 375.48 / QM 6759 / NRRL 1006) TaxID=441959 RepID=B8LY54_TALSN|nr:glycerophosphocholine phosphodiesterase Gde1, putative [Talaromyces stipitatus ATCC 10500]EED23299.1 glycerophosphocholine phosphodiesterase Gde1, putative [Talaromyces stipitatus ATCC 10500]